MHEAALLKAGLVGHYLPLKIEAKAIPAAIKGLVALGFQGLNVTAPHKEAVIPYLTTLSPNAKAIGAVNTLIPDGEGFSGDNTDGPGFTAAYLTNSPNSSALVYGAGGAARAVIHGLRSQGIQVLVTARKFEAAERLAQEFGQKAVSLNELSSLGALAIVVNATSASYVSDLDPVPSLTLAAGALVIDLNYGRPRNHWETLAQAVNGTFYDGLPMLAQQARLSFNLWTKANLALDPFMDQLKIYAKSLTPHA
jgi:shikimate dehydrogenase